MLDRFDEREVPIEEVQDFVNLGTGFRDDAHLKGPVLAPLEREGILTVPANGRKARFRYPAGTTLKFSSKSAASED